MELFKVAKRGLTDSTEASDIQTEVGNGFGAMANVTAACHSVVNTIFTPPEVKPDWFDDLQNKLDNAKSLASDWLDNMAPDIQSSIPTLVINYDSVFMAVTDKILKICEEHPEMKKDDVNYNNVNELLRALIDEIDTDILVDVSNMKEKLKNWRKDMIVAHGDLSSGVGDIQNAEIALQADIEKMNTLIEALNKSIAEYRDNVTLGGVFVGGGIFVGVMGIALLATGAGALAGGIVIGVGAAMIVGGAVTWGVFQAKINDAYDDIAKNRQHIAEDARLLTSLKALELGTQGAVSSIDLALTNVEAVEVMWTGFKNIIEDVIQLLKTTQQKPSALLKATFTEAARNQWCEANKFAHDLLEMNIPVKNKGTIGDNVA